jgi:tetratricopeptide (TPR) repeat protein
MAKKGAKSRRKRKKAPGIVHGPAKPAQTTHSPGARLSLCMIVRNEEEALPECLSSVQGLVDELIVVDTGSTDRTIEIAERFGAKVRRFDWIDDFSAARNESIKHAAGDWILWLDADDRLPQKYHAAIRRLLSFPKDRAFYFRLENVGGDESICYQLRMFPNLPGVRYTMPVHEQVLPSLIRLGVTQMVKTDVSVIHTGYTDPETIAAKNAKYLKIMEQWLETHPEDYVTRAHIARIYHTEGRNTEAVQEYRAIVNNERCRRENELIYQSSWIFLGRACLNLKRYDEAVAAFERSMEIEPDYDIAFICFGEAYTLMDKPDKAIPYLERLREKGGVAVSLLPVEVKSLNYYAHHFLGQNYERKERFDEAVAAYRAAIEVDSRRTEAPTALAQLYANRGRLEEAHRVLDLAIRANPSQPENYVNQAVLYIDQRRYDAAEQALLAALERAPNHSRARFQQGRLYRLRGNFDEAIHAYREAIRLEPEALNAHTELGLLLVDLNRFGEAEDVFDDAVSVCKKAEQEVPIDLLAGYAYSAACNKRREKTLEIYREFSRCVEDARPATAQNLVERWTELGNILLDNRLPLTAAYAMKTAMALAPNSDRAAEGLGDALMRLEKYEGARTQYEQALQLAPNRRELFFKLGDCYLKLGAVHAAHACYQKGLEAQMGGSV